MAKRRAKVREAIRRWQTYGHTCPKCKRRLFLSNLDRAQKVCAPLSMADQQTGPRCSGFLRKMPDRLIKARDERLALSRRK